MPSGYQHTGFFSYPILALVLGKNKTSKPLVHTVFSAQEKLRCEKRIIIND